MKPTNPKHPSLEFYSITELLSENLVPLKSRQLHIRFKKLIKDGILVYGVNLFKKGSAWQIHHSIIPYFEYEAILNNSQLHNNF